MFLFYYLRRLFGTKCDKCSRSFGANDFVMRAKNKIFHLECFRCIACHKQLVPGDEFALRPDGLFCKDCHSIVKSEENNNNTTTAEAAVDGPGDLEDDMDDRSQDDGDDKDLLLLDDPSLSLSHDRFADSGEWKFFLTLLLLLHVAALYLWRTGVAWNA